MSSRACLLCGRPLSRWTGSGDEFCSREHRNQYRLRLSMDRLQEANKVASVMRRRESLRPLQTSGLINGGPSESRAFTDAMVAPQQLTSIPEITTTFTPRMAPKSGTVAIRMEVSSTAKRSVCPGPLPARTTIPVTMPLRFGMADPSPRCAPPVRGIASRVPAAQTRRRPLVTAWRCTTKAVVGRLTHIDPPRAYPMAEGARPSVFGTPAASAKGRALRVSLAAGFRIPEWKLRPALFHGPSGAGMVWPGLQSLQAEAFGSAADATVTGLSPTDMMSSPEMRIPMAPVPVFQTVFRWPDVKTVSVGSANPAVLHRSIQIPITTSDEYSASEEYSAKERTYEYRS